MRITFVVGRADMAGGFRVIAIYARALQQRGHQVLVVSRPDARPGLKDKLRLIAKGKPIPDPRRVPHHLNGSDVEHRLLPERRGVTAADVPDADIVISTWWETAEWVDALPASKGVKVHFIQDYETWMGCEERVDATCRLQMPKITPAKWVKELLETKFGAADVALVPNAVDLQTFTAPPRGKQAVPTVGFMFTSFLNKGSDVCLKACDLARKQLPNLKVVTFGSMPPDETLGLPPEVEFHLRAPEQKLKEIYGACDVWLFGTRREGFGLPILEAMACRTPVIGTPAGAAPELLAPGGGILVPMEDWRAMAEAIVKVCTLPDADWRAMSDNAYATASRYTWDDATDLFEAVLQRAARSARASERSTVEAGAA